MVGAALTGAAPLISLENVTFGYDRRPAVHHLSGAILAGELLAVCGPNGGGKSTLLKGLAGLIRPLGGRVALRASVRDIAFLPQAVEIDRSFPICVEDFVSLGALRRKGLFAPLGSAEADKTSAALAAVALQGFERRTLDSLSGGQLQRTLFARLIVEDRRIILLDEPFGAIDQATTEDLLALIGLWRAEGRTVIAALHEFDLVRRAFPKTLLLAREAIFWGDTEISLSEQMLGRARRMVEAYDENAEECRRDEIRRGRADAL